jgi:hypothetical protein
LLSFEGFDDFEIEELAVGREGIEVSCATWLFMAGSFTRAILSRRARGGGGLDPVRRPPEAS